MCVPQCTQGGQRTTHGHSCSPSTCEVMRANSGCQAWHQGLSPSEPSLPALVCLVCLLIFNFVKISLIYVYGYVCVDICGVHIQALAEAK